MTQPTERRFVMEPRLDAEIETINNALDTKVDLTDPRLTDERVPLDNSVTSAKIVDGTIVNADIANTTIESTKLAVQDYIKFDTTYAGGSTVAGELTWDVDNETLQFRLDDHVTLQIGQEHVIRVKNNSGSVAIPERTVVMFAGATGDTIKVAPAISDGSISVNYLAGITTEQIDADGFGFITQLGFINQVDTNGWPVGTILYADPTVAGGLTDVEPESPAWTIPVAAVTKQSDTAGRILVRALPGGSGAGGGASVNTSDTAPAGGNDGDLWFDTTDGTLYVYYSDLDGNQWVQVQANSALTDSLDTRVGALESQAIAYGAMSPNYIINGDFGINQRNFTSATADGSFGFDRWQLATGGGATYTPQTFAAGTLLDNNESSNYARIVTTGQAGASVYTLLSQKVEDVRTLSGKTITVSFWAKAASGTPKIALEIEQNFGSGGSPSSPVQMFAGSVTLSTSWARYSLTYALPSTSGKTFGTTANSSATRFMFWVSAGTDFSARTSSLGIQSNTFDFWGVQVEKGSVPTSFRLAGGGTKEAELAACRRYYQVVASGGELIGNGQAYGTAQAYVMVQFNTPMRAAPTLPPTLSATTHFQVASSAGAVLILNSITFPSASERRARFNIQVAAGLTAGQALILESNNAAAFIGFNAEL